MKKVITYGTFDLFHEGHRRLLERARSLGDYLIVGVTTESYDESRGKLNVKQSLMERIKNVQESGLADLILIEEYEGQKINDILKYGVDIFAIGSDWVGKFDYLNEFCEVCYLQRTKGVSSTELRSEQLGVLRLGMVGYGRIAKRFILESKYVSGVNVEGVFGRNEKALSAFVQDNELDFYETDYDVFLEKVDAVYIATPHDTHFGFIRRALQKGKHVLCEKPMTLTVEEATEAFSLADDKGCVLLEGIKTAFAPGFLRLMSIAKCGIIGEIRSVEATFTKLVEGDLRELDPEQAGGSMTELASYPLLALVKLLGSDWKDLRFVSYMDPGKNVDLFTQFHILTSKSYGTGKVGLGVKSEGDMVISGSRGYIYVPAPWWKTEYFEVRHEHSEENKKYYYKFEGDGLRYELAEFLHLIHNGKNESYKLSHEDSLNIIKVIQAYRDGHNIMVLE